MLTIGLTGGVGCGKSAVAELFGERGAPIIDADIITRELVTPGSQVLSQIVAAFGQRVLQPDGNLDRRALRAIIFGQADARRRLEAILHPRVRAEIVARTKMHSAPYCVVVVPLLVESSMQDLVDRVLVVDCDEAQQIARVRARDQCSEDEVRAIIATQASRDARLAAADDVLVNTGELPELAAGVERLHERYLTLAGALDRRPADR